MPAATALKSLKKAITIAKTGNHILARFHLNKALEQLPDDPTVWLWLAWVSESPETTIHCLEMVLAQQPDHPLANAGLTWARAIAEFDIRNLQIDDITGLTSAIEGELFPASATNDQEAQESEHQLHLELAGDFTPEVISLPPADTAEPNAERQYARNVVDVIFGRTDSLQPVDDEYAVLAPEETTACQPVAVELAEAAVDAPETANQETAADDEAEPPVQRWGRRQSDIWNRQIAEHRNQQPLVAPTDWHTPTGPAAGQRTYSPPQLTPSAAIPVEPPTDAAQPASTANDNQDETEQEQQVLSEINDITEEIGKQPATPTADSADEQTPQPQYKVLIVDDSPTIRKLVSMTLEKEGYEVVTAFDGLAAVKEIAKHNPDLILMDIKMPRLDGYQLCKLVKKHEATNKIPVIMLSGKDGMFDKLRGRLVGCTDYITKPFQPEILVEAVGKYLQQVSSNS